MATDTKKAAAANTGNGKAESANKAAKKEPRISKNARFMVGETSLLVTLRQGKSGFNVAAQMKTAGQRAQTGSRSTHSSIEAATAAFEQLVASAEAKQWKRKLTGGGSSNAFTEIPAPPAAAPAAAQ